MANRVKEEERIEKIVRGLLKLPENKRCINCSSLGPQYVCTTFWTFICTTCSGIHREFTHRVKSVSMAKFTAEEVSALQAGGNERARQIYLQAWDPQRHSFPDGSNLSKLREYIKHVYVDRKYAGERNKDPLPLVKLNKQIENYDKKYSVDSNRQDSSERPGSSRSSDLKYYHDEWRSSPRYARDNYRSGGYKRSPIRFEVVDDRFRDYGNTRGRKSDPRRTSSVEVMARSLSPVPQKNLNRSMSPVVRPVADMLGENAPQLQVGDTAKGKEDKSCNAPPNNHKNKHTIVAGSSTKQQVPADKKEEPMSLIDFDMDPQPTTSQTITEKETKKETTLASVNPLANANTPIGQSIITLESLLFELNIPTDAAPANMQRSNNNDVTSTALSGDTSAPAGDTSLAQDTLEPAAKDVTSDADLLTDVPIPSTLHSASNESQNVTHGQHQQRKVTNDPAPSFSLESGSIFQESGSHFGTDNNQGQSISSLEQSIQAVSLGGHDFSSITVPGTPAEEARPHGRHEPPPRKELPADLFSLSYWQVLGRQTGQPHATGFGMHHRPTAYQTPGFPNSVISTNPFDLTDVDGSRPDQAEMFQSVAPVRGVLHGAPAAIWDTPVHGTQLDPHPLYSSVPGAHIGHHRPQPPADSPVCVHGFGGAGSLEPASNKSSAPTTQKLLPSIGQNPFE